MSEHCQSPMHLLIDDLHKMCPYHRLDQKYLFNSLYSQILKTSRNNSYLTSTPYCISSTMHKKSGLKSCFSNIFGKFKFFPTVYAESPRNIDSNNGTEPDQLFQSNKDDKIDNVDEEVWYVTDQEVKEYITEETSRERLKHLFSSRIGSMYRDELQLIGGGALYSIIVSFLFMSLQEVKIARARFQQANQSTVFTTKFQAHRAMNDVILMSSIKKGAKWSFKMGLFATSFLCISQGMAVYRNKSGFVEHVTAGAFTGAMFKFNFGLKGMFAAGLLGGTLGLLAGCISYPVLYSMDQVQEQRHFREVKTRLSEKRRLEST